LRERFVADPATVASEAGLSPGEAESIARIPLQDLFTAARSYEHKRSLKRRSSWKYPLLKWLRAKRH